MDGMTSGMMDRSVANQFERLPPHSIEAESCVIGSMFLADADIRAQVRSVIDRDDFYQADHQVIFDVICKMIDDGRPVDEVTIRAELERLDLLAEVGGTEFLMRLIATVPTGRHGRHYAEIVRERSKKRHVIKLSNDLLRRAYSGDTDETGDEILELASREIARINVRGQAAEFWKLGELLADVYDDLGTKGTPLIKTGLMELDAEMGGIGLGEMLIVAARPSMGKSTLLRQILIRAAMAGVPSGLISLEEGGMKIGRNILSTECHIENQKLRRRNLAKEEWEEIGHGIGRLSGLPVFGTDRARRIQDIRAIATTWASRFGVKLILVDYLQRIGGTIARDDFGRVSEVSTALSNLWKELNVAGVVASQLNRGLEDRDDKRPTMRDLRSSGQIEQDADGIVFLHREDFYHLDDSDYSPTRIAELILAKLRDGARGRVVKMESDLKYQCFRDIAMPEVTPYPNNPFD